MMKGCQHSDFVHKRYLVDVSALAWGESTKSQIKPGEV